MKMSSNNPSHHQALLNFKKAILNQWIMNKVKGNISKT